MAGNLILLEDSPRQLLSCIWQRPGQDLQWGKFGSLFLIEVMESQDTTKMVIGMSLWTGWELVEEWWLHLISPPKGILQAAVEGERWRMKDLKGKSPGMIGLMPGNAVTFIDNHDTGSTLKNWPFPLDKVVQGYAYILTHPGIPSSVISYASSFNCITT